MKEEGEEAQKAPQRAGAGPKRHPRLLAAYAVTGLFALGSVVAIVVLSSGASSDEAGNPHINLRSGSTNGVPPDTRVGIEPSALPAPSLKEAASVAKCELRLRLPDEGHTHLPPEAPEPPYGTNPPTSGPHIEDPYQQADGAYSETPPPSAVVHSLEHGRMAIQYNPDLQEHAQLELIGLFGTMHGGTLLFPNPRIPYAVAASTWTNLLGCGTYSGTATLEALRVFGKASWGKYGGESLIGFQPSTPTPRSPMNSP